MIEVLKLMENPDIIRLLAKELSHARVAPHQLRSVDISFGYAELHLSGKAFSHLKAAAVELLHAINAVEDRDFVGVATQAYAPSLSSCQKCAECWHYDTHTATCWLPERREEHTPRRPDFPACAGFVSAKGKADEILQEIEMGENDEF